ncbi:XRE family transcriptional regulator [Heyndrickxia sporothermodurans]|uniref:XRE family transcriptional regulator n=1 Tax=Heyndrickxia sporothermodurans TaxID=46224 RepID=UPI0035E1792E
MSVKDIYILKRRKKKIRLHQIDFIGCSQSLISQYETSKCEMDKAKVEKYKAFIDNY